MDEIVKILYNGNFKVEKIYSFNSKSDWYNQEEDEFVYLLNGFATIEFEDGKIDLKKDEYLFIPKHKKHRVYSTSFDCEWLCIFK